MRPKQVLGQLLAVAVLSVLGCVPAAERREPPTPGVLTVRASEYPGSEGEMPGHLYEPGGSAPLPGVLGLHTLAGPGPNLEAFAKRLAAEGYVTLTPDFFALHDFGPDGRTDHPLILKDARSSGSSDSPSAAEPPSSSPRRGPNGSAPRSRTTRSHPIPTLPARSPDARPG
jgi:hypothetical protein